MRTLRHTALRLVPLCLLAIVGLGCEMHGTQPRLSVERVTLGQQEALVDLAIENDATYDLMLTGIEYTLIVGPLPISEGGASFDTALPAGQSTSLQVRAPIQSQPLDPQADTATFSGEMTFDHGGLSAETTLKGAAFSDEGPVRRR